LPHGREKGEQPAEHSLAFLAQLTVEPGALLIGISLGGLVAAKLQETGRKDLHVICISSPTYADGLDLERRMPGRLALYSSLDAVIAGRTSRWPHLAEALDLPWLTHDTDAHKVALARLIVACISGSDMLNETDRDCGGKCPSDGSVEVNNPGGGSWRAGISSSALGRPSILDTPSREYESYVRPWCRPACWSAL
jgi:pimeloyl-ACP methyl ester carboxylesterase